MASHNILGFFLLLLLPSSLLCFANGIATENEEELYRIEDYPPTGSNPKHTPPHAPPSSWKHKYLYETEDYPPPRSNPRHDPPRHPPSSSENEEELYQIEDYPRNPHPPPRHPPPSSENEKELYYQIEDYPPTGSNPKHTPPRHPPSSGDKEEINVVGRSLKMISLEDYGQTRANSRHDPSRNRDKR